MRSAMEEFMVAPSMPIAVTRARPKVSAKAVADVRRGLRCEFVAANAPTAPKGAPMSLPKSGTIGRLSAGPAMKKPTITPNAPTPTSDARLPVVPSVHKAPQIAKAMPAQDDKANDGADLQRTTCGGFCGAHGFDWLYCACTPSWRPCRNNRHDGAEDDWDHHGVDREPQPAAHREILGA